MLVYYFVPFIVSNRYILFWVSNGHNSVTVQNRTHVYMNYFDNKDLGNHLLQLCPKVVKHPVYSAAIPRSPVAVTCERDNDPSKSIKCLVRKGKVLRAITCAKNHKYVDRGYRRYSFMHSYPMKLGEVIHRLHSLPYRNLQSMENWVHSSLHSMESVTAERCFGQLKLWFPVLRYTVTVDLQNVTSVINCWVVLHKVPNFYTVAELNEYDNEGRLNEMVRDDTEELRLNNSEGEGGN